MTVKRKPASLLFKSMQLNKVLIALDYNATAKKVAEAGYSLAKSMNSEVILMHVVADEALYTSEEYSSMTGFPGFDFSDMQLLIRNEGLIKAAKSFLDKIKAHLGDKKIQTMVTEGNCAESILQAAKDLNTDLMVMGSHSMRWLEHVLLGSVTEKVLRHTKIPLLIIPTKAHTR